MAAISLYRRKLCLAVISILLAGLVIFWLVSIRHAAKAKPLFATITVNTTADTVAADGACSLREAMQAANTNLAVNECPAGAAGLDTIEFNLGTGTPTINGLSALPQISQPLFINGNTGGATRVELNGASAGNNFGLNILNAAGGSTVQALVINRFASGGIILQPGSNGNTVRGCIIGLNASGTASQGNTFAGIIIAGSNNVIGGTTAAARNIISGNSGGGIYFLTASGNANNTVQGNFIGTDINGTAALGNASSGVEILGSAHDNLIGGTTAGAANVISGNRIGIFIRGASANLVQGNFIGTNAAGTGALGNINDGILVSGVNNIIGGTAANASNVIAFNNQNGVRVAIGTPTGNRVLTNAIFSNSALGIDLGDDGVTANDAGDSDTGPNNLQNFPVLTSATSSGGNTTIQGTLNSTANTAFRLEFFSNPSCDASGYGEGQVFLGFANVTTNASGDAAINVTLPVSVTPGHSITATTIDPGNNTSEFSACTSVCAYSIAPTTQNFNPEGGTGTVNVTAPGGCNWTAASNATWLTLSGGGSGVGNGTVNYSVAANATGQPRSGTLTIAGNTFTVNQAACPVVSLSPPTLPSGTTGTPYNQTLSATGGTLTYSFSVTAGALPNGLTLNAATGAISGTPSSAGIFTFTITASAGGCTGTREYSISIVAANNPPNITANVQTRQAGSPAANLSIANVSDNDQAANTLQVRINNGASATNNGVTISNLNVSAAGAVTAEVVAACNAQNAGFTLSVTDNANTSASATLNVTVNANTPPTLSYNNQTVTAGGALTINPASTPSDNGSIASFALLSVAPNTLASTPTINNTSGIVTISNARPAGSYTVTVRATDNCGATTDAAFTLTINCPTITVGPESLPPVVAGQSYNQQLTASSGTGAVSFAITSGALPNGLTLTSDGKLSGSTSVSGSFSFTVTATDSLGCSGSTMFTLSVGCANITLSPASLPSGVTGVEYRQTISAGGGSGTYSFANTGTLPTGLTFSSSGVLSGTPTAAGTFNFTISATNTATNCAGQQNYSVVITCPPITVTAPGVTTGTAGAAFNQSFTQSGGSGSIVWSISSGALPNGLSLNAATGVLSGTLAQTGTFPLTIKATDANGCMGTVNYALTINCQTITINPATLPAGAVGTAYNANLTQSGALGAVTWSISAGALPAGLTLNATTGVISGTPAAAGTSNFTMKVSDANGCMGTRDFTLTFTCGYAINPTSQTFPASGGSGTVNVVTAAGCAWTATSNAAWLTVTSSNGNGNGAVNFIVAANTGTARTGTLSIAGQTFSVTQQGATPTIVTVSAASFRLNTPLAAESIVAAFGANLATSTLVASTLPLPTTLGGTTVKVRDNLGAERNAPLFFVSPAQINYLIPQGTATGAASVTVVGSNAEVLALGSLQIASVAPDLFTANSSGQGVVSGAVLRISSTGAQSFEPLARFEASLGRFVAVPIELGPTGEQVFLVIFGTGFRGRRALDSAGVILGGLDLPVLYAGAQGELAGFDQLNLGPLPRALSGRGNVDLLLTVEGQAANVVQVNIK
jgi:uncharacterized protein (TIGR03437 family)